MTTRISSSTCLVGLIGTAMLVWGAYALFDWRWVTLGIGAWLVVAFSIAARKESK